ncbi:type I-E CRISPR-associated protein Cas6/Cse3/CasE [Catenulispora sp. NL8]|uniref:Type I-E CRISPR-associated protein Cas6/Cse3/CasE n=1 Tax=Catenulispora pinistramenti TaxID=2705254 RepID=A0ABS5KN57_9ACTN|nr:type I-E CRISPR-associated protein Cas6/Cse3/CasE [Catenulispora pinistramenti]MBS2547460.1 type I-E CRISPR-associated protein Cas6/Cse3/CasE [Catenulispora pinistramenti]
MTTWLTRITPDLRHQRAATDLNNAVQMHHTVMKLFPDQLGPQARQTAGVLFRVDQSAIGGITILVQSTIEPNAERLPAGYGEVISRPLDLLLDALRPGLPVRYRLAGNATQKLGLNTKAGKPHQIVPLSGADAEQWWIRQAELSGLDVRSIDAQAVNAATGLRTDPQTRDQQPQRHARTQFDGTAIITDPQLLRTRILAGIGRGKSYGCGLLTLAPTR